MIIIAVSVVVAILGAIAYLWHVNPKVANLGLVAWGAGLLAFLLRVSGTGIGMVK